MTTASKDRFKEAAWNYVQRVRRHLGFDCATRLPQGIISIWPGWDPVSLGITEGQIDPDLETWVTTPVYTYPRGSGYDHLWSDVPGQLWIICWRREDEYLITELPLDVSHFINRWAQGFYPELVL
jgi:hypothetical protein